MAIPSAAEPPDDLQAIIAGFGPDALRLARRLVRSSVEAEDLAQTALANVLARAGSITDPALARAYLMATVRNLWRNQLRAGRRCEPATDLTVLETTANAPGPEDRALASFDAVVVRAAFENLPRSSRKLMWLRYVERLDYADLGRQLGISAAAARQRVHRAREQLRAACFEADMRASSKRACQRTRLRLGRFARGSLPRRPTAEVTLHLAQCPDCAEAFRQLAEIYGTRRPNEDHDPG